MRWNQLAEGCFIKLGSVPDRLWSQRQDIRNNGTKPKTTKPRTDAEIEAMDVADLYAAASEVFTSGEHREARRLLQALTAREPAHFMGWFLKGFCEDALGDIPEAIASYAVCIALQPDFYLAYYNRATMLLREGKVKEALSDFDRADSLEPRNPMTLMNRAIAKRCLRDYAGAERDLNIVLADHPQEVRALLLRHEMRISLGRETEAREDLIKGLNFQPATDLEWTTRGFYRMRDIKKAESAEAKRALAKEVLSDFDRALALNPRFRDALQNKAYLLGEILGDQKAALEVMDQLISYYPDYVPARAGRGVTLARMNRLEGAIKDADFCLLYDRTALGRYQIGSLFAAAAKHDAKHKEKALSLLAESLRLGMGRLELFTTDSDLDPLREDQEFHRLLRVAKELQTLKMDQTKP
jgi:tetratricopeptide (TPR) repeat protein